MTSRAPRRDRQLAGGAAGAVALATGELLTGLARQPTPVTAVAEAVIDLAPAWFVRLGIELFGTADKIALGVGIVALTVLAGAAAGVTSDGRPALAAPWFLAFAAVGLAAAARMPRASVPVAGAALAVAVVAGVVALRLLVRAAAVRPGLAAPALAPIAPVAPTSAPPSPPAGRAHDDTTGAAAGTASAAATTSRRRFLVLVGAAGVAATTAGTLGRVLAERSGAVAARVAAVLRPSRLLPAPAGAQVVVEGAVPVVTPNDGFFRIDTAFVIPRVHPDDWSLRITGMVEQPLELTYDELVGLSTVERWVTLACVSNEVGGSLVGNAAWLGVPLRDLLERAGVVDGAGQVVGRSVDGFTVGFPTQAAFDGRDALVAVGMNGEPLPFRHGFPARLVVEGLYGYVSATKWLTEIELTTWEEFDAYWIPRGWAKEAPVKTQSRIDVPRPGMVDHGPATAAGVAWAPGRGISGVELRVDDGPWVEAELADPLADGAWRQWHVAWTAQAGAVHILRVRATDGSGATQTDEIRPPAPDGATGHHLVRVQVR